MVLSLEISYIKGCHLVESFFQWEHVHEISLRADVHGTRGWPGRSVGNHPCFSFSDANLTLPLPKEYPMFRTVMGFLQHHGFHLMLTGLAVIGICAVFFVVAVNGHHMTLALKNRIFFIAFGGLIIYAVGRVLAFLENRRQRAEPEPGGGKDPA